MVAAGSSNNSYPVQGNFFLLRGGSKFIGYLGRVWGDFSRYLFSQKKEVREKKTSTLYFFWKTSLRPLVIFSKKDSAPMSIGPARVQIFRKQVTDLNSVPHKFRPVPEGSFKIDDTAYSFIS